MPIDDDAYERSRADREFLDEWLKTADIKDVMKLCCQIVDVAPQCGESFRLLARVCVGRRRWDVKNPRGV